MILSLAIAVAVFGLLSLPGWILAANHPHPIWVHAAAGFCSQFAVILLAALVSLASPAQLDVRLVLLIAIVLSVAAYAYGRPRPLSLPARPERWVFLVPVIATLAAALITLSAITMGDDGLTVRAWFNADGFKHLGHVHALASLGLPARDIFGAGGQLSYYWFFYVIPALGAALHGDAVSALIASGLVQTLAFWIVVYGLLRSAGANARWAAFMTLIGWLSPSPDGLVAWAQADWNAAAAVTDVNVEGVNSTLLDAFTLFRLSLYIPQHQFMLAGLVSWATLSILPRAATTVALRGFSFVPIVCAGAVSTLLGIACLAVFAVTRLLDLHMGLVRRVAGIFAVGLAALIIPLALGVVDVAGGNGLDSPIFNLSLPHTMPVMRLLSAIAGLALAYGVSLIGLLGLPVGFARRDLPEVNRNALVFAAVLILVGTAILLGATLLDNRRLALEIQLRTSLLPYLGLVIAGVFLLKGPIGGWQHLPRRLVAVGAPLLILGLMTPIHDVIWHGVSTARWTVRVPDDDLAVLDRIASDVPTQSVVLQYPEMPFVAGGKDLWTPILAGRMVYASHRATQWHAQAERLRQAEAFFAGTGALPDGDYSHIYLSRALHSTTYDLLVRRMAAERGWTQSLCLADACLWRRS